MKKIALTLFLAALPAAAAVAQDLPVALAGEPALAYPWGREIGGLHTSLGRHASASIALVGRVSFPDDSDVTSDGVTWADLFDPGFGFSLEGDFLVRVVHDGSVGGYVSVGWDSFSGVRNTDSFGDSAEPDVMNMMTILAGAKSMGWFDPLFFWEGRIGLGMVHYDTVKAGFVLGGTPFDNQEFFRASNRLAFELGGRIGFGTEHVTADLGMGFRVLGAPARGRDVTNLIDPDPLTTFMIELGLRIGF